MDNYNENNAHRLADAVVETWDKKTLIMYAVGSLADEYMNHIEGQKLFDEDCTLFPDDELDAIFNS